MMTRKGLGPRKNTLPLEIGLRPNLSGDSGPTWETRNASSRPGREQTFKIRERVSHE